MSSPQPPQDRVTPGRVLPWVVLAILLAAGLVLYFRFGGAITSVVGTGR